LALTVPAMLKIAEQLQQLGAQARGWIDATPRRDARRAKERRAHGMRSCRFFDEEEET
jgi:hypothetical protein